MKRTLFLFLYAFILSASAGAQSTTTLINELRSYRAEVDSLCNLASYNKPDLDVPLNILVIRDTGSRVSSLSPKSIPYERVFFLEMAEYDLVKLVVREKGERPLTRVFYFRNNKVVYASQEIKTYENAVSFR